MSTDPKQTLPSSEALDLCKTQEDTSLSTTLIQPTTRSRQSELCRTRYWEQRSEEHKRHAVHGNTRIGLGPSDPLVQAVQAVKLQLMQATQPQPLAAAPTEPPVKLPKRQLKPTLIAAAAVGSILCAASIGALTNKPSPKKTEAPALVKPAPPRAPTTTPTAPEPAEPPLTSAVTERTAADALFAGDYPRAKRLYERLAQTHPEQPAFAEAARILSRNPAADSE